jgi:hypothetical protein
MDSRIFLIENSKIMGEMDSHVMRASQNCEVISRTDGVSRWSELSQVSWCTMVYLVVHNINT